MSDWQTAITEAAAALADTFGSSFDIAGQPVTARLWSRQLRTVETETGHLRISSALLTVNRAALATRIDRGAAVVDSAGDSWTVRGIINETAAARTYEIYRKD